MSLHDIVFRFTEDSSTVLRVLLFEDNCEAAAASAPASERLPGLRDPTNYTFVTLPSGGRLTEVPAESPESLAAPAGDAPGTGTPPVTVLSKLLLDVALSKRKGGLQAADSGGSFAQGV